MPISEHIFEHIFARLRNIFHVFENKREQWSVSIVILHNIQSVKAVVMALHQGNSFLIIISRAHHRKVKVSNLLHANLCSFSLLVIVSRCFFPELREINTQISIVNCTASSELHGNLSRNKSKP